MINVIKLIRNPYRRSDMTIVTFYLTHSKQNVTAMADVYSESSKRIENIDLTEKNQTHINGNHENSDLELSLPLDEVYRLALNFYKEKSGKACHFSYEDNVQLVAFSQQVVHGPMVDVLKKLPPLGTLDVVGKDRREAWLKLGQLSRDQARTGFVELLSRRCPLFSTFVEAHRRERDEQKKKEKLELIRKQIQEIDQRKKEEEERQAMEQMQQQEAIKRQIQQALNKQTYEQFRKYAEQQYPGDPEKQGSLIRQLQDQHYIQYMQQLELSQRADQINEKKEEESNHVDGNSTKHQEEKDRGVDTSESLHEDDDDECQISAASMWTLPDIEAFKQRVSQTEGDCVVRVGHGETITVRVPTHPQGSRIFWEFATDHYDIGFGIYFEFGTPTTEEVSVLVSESDDEEVDLDEDELYADETLRCDLESGGLDLSSITKPPLMEIVPVYRRDCQTEVYAGSHLYPGRGVYLLKFDNSYSLWRSKTLYYRVYYTH